MTIIEEISKIQNNYNVNEIHQNLDSVDPIRIENEGNGAMNHDLQQFNCSTLKQCLEHK